MREEIKYVCNMCALENCTYKGEVPPDKCPVGEVNVSCWKPVEDDKKDLK